MNHSDDDNTAFPLMNGFITTGMSLRDYYTAAALQGLLSSHGLSFDPTYITKFAKTACDYADAIIKERKARENH